MKVLMIGWELPPNNSGGLGKACLGLSKSLSEKGVDITFVLPEKGDYKISFMKLLFADTNSAKVKLLGAYTPYAIFTFPDGKTKIMPFGYVEKVLSYATKIHDLIEELKDKEEFDVIHAHDWLTVPAALEAKKILHLPLVLHIHATEIDRTGGHSPNESVYEIEREGMRQADKIVAVSNFTKDTIVKNYGIDASKIEVVHNGIGSISAKRFAPALSKLKDLGYKVVLYLGRISLMKGPEYFVYAAHKVLQYDSKVIFVVAGSGDMSEDMMTRAFNLGISKNIIFTGWLRGDEKARIYQAADLYVLPSVSEPFGLTVLESIQNGTPVIVSKQSGVSEVINHALKVDFWDIDEMANKILSALKYPLMQKVLIDESRKELGNLTWDKAADKCIGVYNQL